MLVSDTTQAALEKAHAALDAKRAAVRELDDTIDQEPFARELAALTNQIDGLTIPQDLKKPTKAAPKKTATKAAPKKKTAARR